jgi:hypothetical protein
MDVTVEPPCTVDAGATTVTYATALRPAVLASVSLAHQLDSNLYPAVSRELH